MLKTIIVLLILVPFTIAIYLVLTYSAWYRSCEDDPFAENWSQSRGCYYTVDGVRVPTYLHPEFKNGQ